MTLCCRSESTLQPGNPQAKKKSNRSWCCAYVCSSSLEKCPGLAFHRFLNEKRAEIRNAWIKAVRRQDWTPTSSSVLCSEHVKKDCYKIPPGIGRKPMLKSDAIPTIFTAYRTYLHPKAVKIQTPTIRTESLPKRGRTSQTAASTIIPDPENTTPGDTTIHDDEQPAASSNQDTPTASTTSCRHGGRPKQPAVTLTRNYTLFKNKKSLEECGGPGSRTQDVLGQRRDVISRREDEGIHSLIHERTRSKQGELTRENKY
ncbi:THAP domain-containing protein 1-like [Watersipora subatra]|uniref:THAP domain-containing protein 1-like n=1 Tax=Watersipora subatra TaxID=2589382 RepID=UPI00355BFEB2